MMATLYYAARLAPDCDPHGRRARRVQSGEAEALLSDLRAAAGLPQGPSSKSHARAMCAVAAAESGRVGVDVEWIGAARDLTALARFLLDSADFGGDVEALYRVWTFREAAFKAFGVFPDLAQRRSVFLARDHGEAPWRWGEGALLFRRLERDFQMCVAWDQAGAFTRLL